MLKNQIINRKRNSKMRKGMNNIHKNVHKFNLLCKNTQNRGMKWEIPC